MKIKEADKYSPETAGEVNFYNPKRFGFESYYGGWRRNFPDFGATCFAPISWQHNQLTLNDENGRKINVIDFLARKQKEVFGLSDTDIMSPQTISSARATGGAVIAAYEMERGFTPDGWLGFVGGVGSNSGMLVSKMIGVRPDRRGKSDIGWYLKLMQAYEAVRTGHDRVQVTFDPMRGINANLNIGKLGGVVDEFTISRYGEWKTELFGNAPTDRFTVDWRLNDPRVLHKFDRVREWLPPQDDIDYSGVPFVDSTSVDAFAQSKPETLLYEIPDNIDELTLQSPSEARRWRRDMRTVLSKLMTTNSVKSVYDSGNADPALIYSITNPGSYMISDFRSIVGDENKKQNFYVLQRRS